MLDKPFRSELWALFNVNESMTVYMVYCMYYMSVVYVIRIVVPYLYIT